jgi:hypothetical protein
MNGARSQVVQISVAQSATVSQQKRVHRALGAQKLRKHVKPAQTSLRRRRRHSEKFQ